MEVAELPRKAKHSPSLRIQSLSTGEYRSVESVGFDDFTGEAIHSAIPAERSDTLPPTSAELDAAHVDKQRSAAEAEQARERALADIRRQTMPERFMLRRPIDMTVNYPTKAPKPPSKPLPKVPPRKKP